MKFRIAALLILPALAQAQAYGSGVDGQSLFQISSTQPFTVTSGSTLSTALPRDTRHIRLVGTTAFHWVRGDASATATVSNTFVAAGVAEYFKINPTDGNYIAVTRDTADGKVWLDILKP